ncbi:hypothetical protein FV768_23765 [Vibrio parahaemolyticus]|nr:hypothetical protein [Vibrio parahaemolyticus]
MKKPNMPYTDLIDSEYLDTDCDSFGESYVCNDCGNHDIGLNANQEAFCGSCASLNVVIE